MKTVSVSLRGLTPIMFDAFRGQEELPVERKLYIARSDQKSLILPASNIVGFLASRSSVSCLRAFVNNRDWRVRTAELQGNVAVSPAEIKFTDGNRSIEFDGSWTDALYIDERMARPSDTARVIARRPVLEPPWQLDFELTLNETEFISEDLLRDWFERGGLSVGIGAYRPMFGRFEVVRWEVS